MAHQQQINGCSVIGAGLGEWFLLSCGLRLRQTKGKTGCVSMQVGMSLSLRPSRRLAGSEYITQVKTDSVLFHTAFAHRGQKPHSALGRNKCQRIVNMY